jgi:hypothetical protein
MTSTTIRNKNMTTLHVAKTIHRLALRRALLFVVLTLAVAAFTAVPARATLSTGGVITEILSQCNFGELDILTKTDISPDVATHFWKARIDTKGATDVYVVRVTFPPGGSTGWHTHPGPSLITVVAGNPYRIRQQLHSARL